MSRQDWRRAAESVWGVVSVVLLVVLAAPFLLGTDRIGRWTPVCEAKQRGGSCPLCGMTTSFLAISRGDLDGARTAHRGGIALYSAFLLNEFAGTAYLWRRVRTCK